MSKKLLIVDDQPGSTKVVARVAHWLGLEFKAVHDPHLAVAEFIAFRPDILILDMIMPELDDRGQRRSSHWPSDKGRAVIRLRRRLHGP